MKSKVKRKDYHYNGKNYTFEGLKRKLMLDGVVKSRVETNYYINDSRYDFDEWGYVTDFNLLLDHLIDCGLVEDTEFHYECCEGKYPFPSDITDNCKDCPFKKDCKDGKL